MQQYFLDYAIENEIVSFNQEQAHHISKVLRMRNDDVVKVVDQNKKAYLVKLNISKDNVEGKIFEELAYTEEKVKIHLIMGMLKKDKWDYMIQKCCELGVDKITPLLARRCVVKANDKTDKKIDRYNKIALEACEQCKRDTIVSVESPCKIADVASMQADLNLVAYEDSDINGLTLKKVLNKDIKNINIVIGPEGGFDKDEIEYLMDNNYQCISLGKRILRAETAAISSVANISFYFEEE